MTFKDMQRAIYFRIYMTIIFLLLLLIKFVEIKFQNIIQVIASTLNIVIIIVILLKLLLVTIITLFYIYCYFIMV